MKSFTVKEVNAIKNWFINRNFPAQVIDQYANEIIDAIINAEPVGKLHGTVTVLEETETMPEKVMNMLFVKGFDKIQRIEFTKDGMTIDFKD